MTLEATRTDSPQQLHPRPQGDFRTRATEAGVEVTSPLTRGGPVD